MCASQLLHFTNYSHVPRKTVIICELWTTTLQTTNLWSANLCTIHELNANHGCKQHVTLFGPVQHGTSRCTRRRSQVRHGTARCDSATRCDTAQLVRNGIAWCNKHGVARCNSVQAVQLVLVWWHGQLWHSVALHDSTWCNVAAKCDTAWPSTIWHKPNGPGRQRGALRHIVARFADYFASSQIINILPGRICPWR